MLIDSHTINFLKKTEQKNLALVLVSVIGTEGFSYRKAGAAMMLRSDGARLGLVSGGCFESDLQQRAEALFEDDLSKQGFIQHVEYDLRDDDDIEWGLGLGCNGLVRLMLQRVLPDQLRMLLSASEQRENVLLIRRTDEAAGWQFVSAQNEHKEKKVNHLLQQFKKSQLNRHAGVFSQASHSYFVEPMEWTPRLLICGAGPDVLPLLQQSLIQGWLVTVVDHRPAYLQQLATSLYSQNDEVNFETVQPENLSFNDDFEAMVVMSHHFLSDAHYLAATEALTNLRYIGVLGPRTRYEQLCAGGIFTLDDEMVFSPIGLRLGGDTPEAIALSVCAEIQQVLCSGKGESFKGHTGSIHV